MFKKRSMKQHEQAFETWFRQRNTKTDYTSWFDMKTEDNKYSAGFIQDAFEAFKAGYEYSMSNKDTKKKKIVDHKLIGKKLERQPNPEFCGANE